MQDAFRAAALMLAAAAAQAATPELPAPHATPPAFNPPQVVGWPAGARPKAPPGFRVSAFARGLDSPRWLAVLPNGDVLVAEARTELPAAVRARMTPEQVKRFEEAVGRGPSADRVTLLRDADRDGVAEQQFTLVEDLDHPFGMLLRRDRLYIAGTDAVWSYSFLVGQTRVNAQPKKLLDLPAGGYDDPWTHSLATDRDEKRLYVAVGSGSRSDEERVDEPDPQRATILSVRWDGTDVGVVASGLRNPAGMAFEPVTGKLWAVVNERDLPGDELVPDSLTEVQRGAVHHSLGADVAPLGLAFYGARVFPERFHGGAFIGLHGSWDRSRLAGYCVAFVPFAAGRPAGPVEEFLSGFIKDADHGEVYGRPAGVAVARDGALLVADEGGNTIWRVAPH